MVKIMKSARGGTIQNTCKRRSQVEIRIRNTTYGKNGGIFEKWKLIRHGGHCSGRYWCWFDKWNHWRYRLMRLSLYPLFLSLPWKYKLKAYFSRGKSPIFKNHNFIFENRGSIFNVVYRYRTIGWQYGLDSII